MTAPALSLSQYITNESSKSTKDRELKSQFGNGFAQHAPDGLNTSIDSWKLVYKPLANPDLTTLRDFLTVVGTTTWFTWTPFGEATAKKWRVVADSKNEKMINMELIVISFTIQQCFDLGT